jgi:uncharacterized protein
MLTMDHLHVSWSEYHKLIEKLALQIHESGWEFDEILCLARGGMRVGDVLSRIFDKPLGVLFTSSYREDAGTKQSSLLIAESISSARPMQGPRILIADDLVDSGHTYARLMPQLRERYPHFTDMRTAVLWMKAVSSFKPDFYVDFLPSSPWIHQPFEEYDTLEPVQLAARLR